MQSKNSAFRDFFSAGLRPKTNALDPVMRLVRIRQCLDGTRAGSLRLEGRRQHFRASSAGQRGKGPAGTAPDLRLGIIQSQVE